MFAAAEKVSRKKNHHHKTPTVLSPQTQKKKSPKTSHHQRNLELNTARSGKIRVTPAVGRDDDGDGGRSIKSYRRMEIMNHF
ncbi:hypothetical protein BVRB_6g142600 [Beta vulgaris subsp. vulgaris]|nr:hypothetical protein BVRB_6g142600 [Beta vulgaris subsp. vulgaris]